MKLFSWNVNGIRAIEKKGFVEWLNKAGPDILAIQETKVQETQLTDSLLKIKGYFSYWHCAQHKGYSGVGLYTKEEPAISRGWGVKRYDDEGRVLRAEFDKFVLYNIYFPNGNKDHARLNYKMGFYYEFLNILKKELKKNKTIIICGDVNTAHNEIDLARPKENSTRSGFLPQERKWIDDLLNIGFVDTFREMNKSVQKYSWWDYKTGARARDVGWRIDYFFINKKSQDKLKDAFILNDIYGSDHCPIGIEITVGC